MWASSLGLALGLLVVSAMWSGPASADDAPPPPPLPTPLEALFLPAEGEDRAPAARSSGTRT